MDVIVASEVDLSSALRTHFPGILKGSSIYSSRRSLRGTSVFHRGGGWNEHDPVCHCFYLWFDLNNATSHITVALSGCLILDLSSCQVYCLTTCGQNLFQPLYLAGFTVSLMALCRVLEWVYLAINKSLQHNSECKYVHVQYRKAFLFLAMPTARANTATFLVLDVLYQTWILF